jgi:hypothetical protein
MSEKANGLATPEDFPKLAEARAWALRHERAGDNHGHL